MHQSRLTESQQPYSPQDQSPFARIAAVERAHVLEYVGESCTNRQRLLLILRYGHGSTFSDIALALKVSQQAVEQMHARALTRMRCALKRVGIQNIHQI